MQGWACHQSARARAFRPADGVQERKLLPLRPGTEEQEGLAWPQLKEPLKARISAMVLPHMDKVAAGAKAVNRRSLGHGGEDAYFYTQADNLVGLGVADGVFMWRDQGIDSGEMSRALMESAKWAVEHGVNDPLLVLGNAWYKTYHRGVQGSSTATVLVADTTTGLLKSSLLGDSGYMIISKRPDLSGGARGRPQHGPQYVERFRSPQQEHQFGYPYQLGHHDTSDRPEDALNMRHRVGRGDVIVLGSDGLFDNVHTEEIVSCVNGPSVSKDGRLLPSAIAQVRPLAPSVPLPWHIGHEVAMASLSTGSEVASARYMGVV